MVVPNSQVSRFCRRIAFRLLRRDCRKYGLLLLALHLGHWRIERWCVRLVRAAYLYFRHLDDVADGDAPCSVDRVEFLRAQQMRWRGRGGRAAEEVDALLDHVLTQCERRGLPLAPVRVFASSILRGLEWDLQRRAKRSVPTRRELAHYYARVVLAPARLAHVMVGAQADLRALRELSGLIGRVQSARDLEVDLAHGLINIPREDMEHPGSLSGRFALPRAVKAWRAGEVEQCALRLAAMWKRWDSIGDARSRVIMRPVMKGLAGWAERYVRTNYGQPLKTLRPVAAIH